MNRMITLKKWTIQPKTLSRFYSTEYKKKVILYAHPTTALSTFNQQLESQFRFDRPPKKILANVLNIVQEMKQKNVTLDNTSYSALLTAYFKAKDDFKAMKTFKEMTLNGIEPTIDNYNTILEGLGDLGFTRKQLFIKQQMMEKGIELAPSSYLFLLRGFCNAKQMDDAFMLFEEMQQKGIEPNLAIYSTLIDGHFKVSQIDKAFQLLRQAEENAIPIEGQPKIYIEMMYLGAVNNDLKIAEYCWQKAKQNHIRFDEGSLLHVIGVAGKKGNTKLITDILGQLSKDGYTYKEHHLTPLMEAFIQKKDLKSAFNVLDIMRTSGIIPTTRTTLPISQKLGKNIEEIDRAYGILEEMKIENKPIDVTIFNAIVLACAEAKDLERTIAIYREASNLGVTPNVDTYNAVLDVCIKKRMKGMGNVVIEEMKRALVEANLETYNKMIQLSCTQKNYEEAFSYLEEMKRQSMIPSKDCYIQLAQKLSFEKDPRFYMLIEEMKSLGYK